MDRADSACKPGKSVTCPYCSSDKTELLALFGQQLLTVQYYCNACHTPFEYIKDDDVDDEQMLIYSTEHTEREPF